MKRLSALAVILLCVAAPAFGVVSISDHGEVGPNVAKLTKKVEAARPVMLTTAERDSLEKTVLKDRSATEIWLQTAPTSYLAAVARRDFGAKNVITLGTDPASDLRLVDSTLKARHLRVTVVGDSFKVEVLDPGAFFSARGDSLQRATLAPSAIKVGRFTVRLSHQHYPALIVFDPQSPRFSEYKGLRWYPFDPGYRYVAALTPNPEPDTVEITSTHSDPRSAVRAGWFVLTIQGKRCVIEATRLLEPGVDEDALSLFFRDETTGKDTYDVGRYLEPEEQDDGTWVIDFNNAYNPACAVSNHYNCPIPPKFNKLKVALRAGEMNHHYAVKKK